MITKPIGRGYTFFGLTALLGVGMVMSLGIGPVEIAPLRIVELLAQMAGWGGPANGVAAVIIGEIRLPRILLAV